ncbi:uncharacterized protein LOC111291765 [Durio zibethinus]|uniref:Uncharacterized protein LOC111291765 n=1 Tax=Durio zibethinus TaxID=66656 RepID=A0A6P5YHD5_DURZI|nr:uncharacterized protein LOC111291765 [Durio zibethinus]
MGLGSHQPLSFSTNRIVIFLIILLCWAKGIDQFRFGTPNRVHQLPWTVRPFSDKPKTSVLPFSQDTKITSHFYSFYNFSDKTPENTMIQIAKNPKKPVTTLGHQLLQRCTVSGTAKGKSKLKAGQPLKRSKISTKKGKGGAPIDDSLSKGGRIPDEKQRLYDQCLNAPTPVRHLSPKERAREAEREKLGLISKERQREMEILKKGGRQTMGVPDEPMIMGTPGLDLITLGLVDADKIPKYELTVEDGRRLAKEYSRVLMRKHRARQAAETNLLRVKREAIEALPEKLKQAAMVPDLTPFPANRFMATLTPPIEGYIEKVRDAAKKSSAKQKLR